MATSTRFLGLCPICERDIKVRDDRLVHHGYRRPGDGEIHGDCFGVNYPPYELSPDAAVDYAFRVAAPMVTHRERAVQYLGEPPYNPPTLSFTVGYKFGLPIKEAKTQDQVDRYEWEHQLKMSRVNAANALEWAEEDLMRLERLIAKWEPSPLREVEEEVSKKESAKAARTAELTAARETKLAEALVALQGRIDSAVKNKRPGTLQNLYQDGWRKLYTLSQHKLRQPEVLRLLDRDSVWAAFGLIQDGQYVIAYDAVLQLFRPWSPYGGPPAPFPAALGGGKAKT